MGNKSTAVIKYLIMLFAPSFLFIVWVLYSAIGDESGGAAGDMIILLPFVFGVSLYATILLVFIGSLLTKKRKVGD